MGSGKSVRVIDMVELIQARCLEVLGYRPEIVRPEPTEDDESPDLKYRIDKLLSTGFSLCGNAVLEIDETLRMCDDCFLNVN